jgi:TorA maturation chaperone TorD
MTLEPQELATILACEFAGLFLNAGSRSIYPFESVYTSGQRLIMQAARDRVRTEYQQAGLQRSSEFKEPEDHIAVELDFMFFLCSLAFTSIAEVDVPATLRHLARQQDFLHQHLLPWVPSFCSDLEKAATNDFYRGLARMTAEFLGTEEETLQTLVAEVKEEDNQ